MIPQADANARREPVCDQRDANRFPRKEERSRQATCMNGDHPDEGHPIDVLPIQLIGVEPVVNFLRSEGPLDPLLNFSLSLLFRAAASRGSNYCAGHHGLPVIRRVSAEWA